MGQFRITERHVTRFAADSRENIREAAQRFVDRLGLFQLAAGSV